jgi:hypothetical protein
VLVGPTCPVEQIGHPCDRQVRFTAMITIRREPAGDVVARVRASTGKRFRVALRPATYLLVPQSGHPFPRSSSQTVVVRGHRYTSVVVRYDTGIR